MPDLKIFGTAGLAETTFANPADGGIPLSVDPQVVLTSPALAPARVPALGARVHWPRTGAGHGPPEPDAIFGDEAMSLLLDAIDRATDHGTRPAVRADVRNALFATRDRHSVLGTYSIDANGDTTLRRFGVYDIVQGRLTFWEAIEA